MARRGQLVGDAYVRIHADSSAMDREIRRDLLSKAGTKALADEKAQEVVDEINRSMKRESNAKLKTANRDLIRGMIGGKKDWERQWNASGLTSLDDFVTRVKKRLGRVTAAAEQVGDIRLIKDVEDAMRRLDKFATEAKAAQALKQANVELREQMRLGARMASDVERSIKKRDAAERKFQQALGGSIVRDMQKQEKALRKFQEALGNSIVRDMKKEEKEREAVARAALKIQQKLADENSKIWFESFKKQEKAILDQDRAWQTYADNVGRKLPSAFSRLKASVQDDAALRRWADRIDGPIARTFIRLDKRLDSSATKASGFARLMGRVFGKGSRNDFLNFVGSIVGGAAQIGVSLVHAGARVGSFAGMLTHTLSRGLIDVGKGLGSLFTGKGFGALGEALTNAGKGLGDIGVQLGFTLAGGLKMVIPLVIALTAALAAMQFIMFPLIALVANLAGALFILAAEISVALAGALLAAAPVLLAVAGGITAIVFAVKGLKNATDKQKAAMKPFNKEWEKFEKILDGPFLDQFIGALNNLAPLIRTVLTPLLKGFSTVIARVANEFAALFTGPRIQPALKKFIESLPVIFGKVGSGLAELAAGLIEFFEPILPFAERLAGWFETLMTTFNDWASSAEGKNAVKDFMVKAWEAAKDVKDIIEEVMISLGLLIGIATGDEVQKGGKDDTFLDSIRTSLERFNAWLRGDGKAAFEEFFTNAKDTMSQLGASITTVSTALAGVDWVSATSTANSLLDAIGKITAAFVILGSDVPLNVKLMEVAWFLFGDAMKWVFNNVIYPVVQGVIGLMIVLLTQISLLFRAMGTLIPGNDPFDQIATEIDTAITKLATLSSNIQKIPDGDANIDITARLRIQASAGAGSSAAAEELLRRGGLTRFRRAGGALLAAGGILNGATFIRQNVIAGEAGREAVVPLDRPLALVDRSVRDLSAIARGMAPTRMASGGILGGGVTVAPGAIVVTAPNADPVLVAESVIDRLAANIRI